jgi:hypothetical protein
VTTPTDIPDFPRGSSMRPTARNSVSRRISPKHEPGPQSSPPPLTATTSSVSPRRTGPVPPSTAKSPLRVGGFGFPTHATQHSRNARSIKRAREWRLERIPAESKLRGEAAPFWNPDAKAPSKRWEPGLLRREWHRACRRAGVSRISFQRGTRHPTSTALGEALPERVLRVYRRQRSAKLLDRPMPRATPEAIVRALKRDDTTR